MPFGENAQFKLTGISLFLLNFLSGLLLRNQGLFHSDSVVLAQAVERTYQTGHLQPAVYGRYGVVIVNSILYFPFYLGGQSAEFTTLLSSVLFHSLSVAVFFLLIYEFFASRVQAVFGALLLSFTPFYFSPNTYGKEHGMCMFFFLLSLYLLHRGVRIRSLWLIGLSSFFCGFSVSVRESILAAIPLYFLLYFSPDICLRPFKLDFPRERFDQKMLLSVILPFSIILITLISIYLSPIIFTALFQRSTAIANFAGLFSSTLGIALTNIFKSIPTVLFVFFIAGVLLLKKREKPFLLFFLVFWTLLFFIFGNVSNYKPRFLDIIITPFYIIASYALAWLYTKFRVAAVAFVAYCVMSMFMFMYPMLSYRHHYCGEKQLALYVKSVTEKNAIIITADQLPFIEYYGHRAVVALPFGESPVLSDFVVKVSGFLKKGVPVYYTESPWYINIELAERLSVKKYFKINFVGEVLSEDFHNPELGFCLDYQKIFKVDLKESIKLSESPDVPRP